MYPLDLLTLEHGKKRIPFQFLWRGSIIRRIICSLISASVRRPGVRGLSLIGSSWLLSLAEGTRLIQGYNHALVEKNRSAPITPPSRMNRKISFAPNWPSSIVTLDVCCVGRDGIQVPLRRVPAILESLEF